MSIKQMNNQGSAPHYLLIGFLIIGIIVFVGAIVSQNFSIFSEAASTEPGCTRKQPRVQVLPATGKANPGMNLTYQLLIRNNDSQACGPSRFEVAYTLPSGLTLNGHLLNTLVDAGTEVSSHLAIRSSSSLAVGDHKFTVSIKDSLVSEHTASGTFSYHIVKQPVNPSAPPKVINNKPVIATRYLPNAIRGQDYNASIYAQDPDNEVVSLSVTNVPDGITVSCGQQTVPEPRVYCNLSGKVTAPAKLYVVNVVATDVRGGVSSRNINLRVLRSGILSILP